MERNKLLAMHTYKKWLGSDGYWRTYIPKKDRPHGRMLCKKKSEEELDNAIIFYLKEQLEDPTVTEDLTFPAFEAIGIPCGRDYYYDHYRRFFWILDKLRE